MGAAVGWLIGWRMVWAVLSRSQYVPDETWQSVEVAHRMVWGTVRGQAGSQYTRPWGAELFTSTESPQQRIVCSVQPPGPPDVGVGGRSPVLAAARWIRRSLPAPPGSPAGLPVVGRAPSQVGGE